MGEIRLDRRGRNVIITFRVGIGQKNIPLLTKVVEKGDPEAVKVAIQEGLAHFRGPAAS